MIKGATGGAVTGGGTPAAAATATIGGVTLGGKITPIPIIARKVVAGGLENNLNNMPKKLNNAITGECLKNFIK